MTNPLALLASRGFWTRGRIIAAVIIAAALLTFLLWPRGTSKLSRIHALRDWLLAEVAAEAALAPG